VDGGLLMVIAFENLSGGMGTAAFLAFLMSLCNQRFTATQFALLSAFASVGRVWVGPLAGVLAESIGWPAFFIVSTIAALPALAMLWWMRAARALELEERTEAMKRSDFNRCPAAWAHGICSVCARRGLFGLLQVAALRRRCRRCPAAEPDAGLRGDAGESSSPSWSRPSRPSRPRPVRRR
jgi:MFS family permease